MTTSSAMAAAAGAAGWPEDLIEVARIGEAWGVQGGFKVQPFSSDPQALLSTKHWYLRPAELQPGAVLRPDSGAAAGARLSTPHPLRIKSIREQGEALVATAHDIADRTGAEWLRGARVFVSRTSFPSPEPDEYYWVDLIGLTAVNRQGHLLGTVTDLIDTGPHCVLRCLDESQTERLIPFVSAYIDSVSLQERRIVADWGLDY